MKIDRGSNLGYSEEVSSRVMNACLLRDAVARDIKVNLQELWLQKEEGDVERMGKKKGEKKK